MNLLSLAFFTGFFGDALLQIATCHGMGGDTGWGLNEYFIQHGKAEAMFIAGGMLTLFYILFLLFFKGGEKKGYIYLAIYGIVLDLIFRKFMIFPSLQGYYDSLNYFWSAFWGAIPLIVPFFVYN